MSSAFLNQQPNKISPTPANIQRLLDENTQLILCIAENQNKGNAAECISYQQVLHKNLVYLATIADYNQQNSSTSQPNMSFDKPDQQSTSTDTYVGPPNTNSENTLTINNSGFQQSPFTGIQQTQHSLLMRNSPHQLQGGQVFPNFERKVSGTPLPNNLLGTQHPAFQDNKNTSEIVLQNPMINQPYGGPPSTQHLYPPSPIQYTGGTNYSTQRPSPTIFSTYHNPAYLNPPPGMYSHNANSNNNNNLTDNNNVNPYGNVHTVNPSHSIPNNANLQNSNNGNGATYANERYHSGTVPLQGYLPTSAHNMSPSNNYGPSYAHHPQSNGHLAQSHLYKAQSGGQAYGNNSPRYYNNSPGSSNNAAIIAATPSHHTQNPNASPMTPQAPISDQTPQHLVSSYSYPNVNTPTNCNNSDRLNNFGSRADSSTNALQCREQFSGHSPGPPYTAETALMNNNFSSPYYNVSTNEPGLPLSATPSSYDDENENRTNNAKRFRPANIEDVSSQHAVNTTTGARHRADNSSASLHTQEDAHNQPCGNHITASDECLATAHSSYQSDNQPSSNNTNITDHVSSSTLSDVITTNATSATSTINSP